MECTKSHWAGMRKNGSLWEVQFILAKKANHGYSTRLLQSDAT